MTLLANADGGVDRIERYEEICGLCDGVGAIAERKGGRCVAYVPCPECEGAAMFAKTRELPPPEEEEC